MKTNSRIASALAVGFGAWLLTCCVKSIQKQSKVRVAKTHAKEAVQCWEGEGGAIKQ